MTDTPNESQSEETLASAKKQQDNGSKPEEIKPAGNLGKLGELLDKVAAAQIAEKEAGKS